KVRISGTSAMLGPINCHAVAGAWAVKARSLTALSLNCLNPDIAFSVAWRGMSRLGYARWAKYSIAANSGPASRSMPANVRLFPPDSSRSARNLFIVRSRSCVEVNVGLGDFMATNAIAAAADIKVITLARRRCDMRWWRLNQR